MSDYGLGIITGVIVSVLGYLFVRWMEWREEKKVLFPEKPTKPPKLNRGDD